MSRLKIEIANNILDRVKEIRDHGSDADLAYSWGRNPSTIATWRKSGSISLEPIVEHEGDVNFNWLFFGDLPKWRDQIDKEGNVNSDYVPGGSEVEEPSADYSRNKMVSKIMNLPVGADEKLELLKSYIELLDQSKPTTKPTET